MSEYVILKHDDEKRLLKTITINGLDTFTTKGGNIKIKQWKTSNN